MAETKYTIAPIGERFGRWTVLGFSRAIKCGRRIEGLWLCRCDCGTEKAMRPRDLRAGKPSCTCSRQARRTHHMLGTVEYSTWQNMLQRCNNPNNPRYADYGKRGITACERWRNFNNFFKDMGLRPSSEHTLEREDNERGYGPDNCKWATRSEQQQNRRVNHLITWDGRTQVLQEWAKELGYHRRSLAWRLARWPLERAMTTPVLRKHR